MEILLERRIKYYLLRKNKFLTELSLYFFALMKTLLESSTMCSLPTAAMGREILSQAIAWGLSYEPDEDGPKIFPRRESERWKLKLIDDRWLLSIGNAPQIRFCSQEALAFIARRR